MRKYQKAYVFGGMGFIGTHVIKYLKEKKIVETIICIDKEENAKGHPVDGIVYETYDVADKVYTLLGERNDLIINLIGLRTFPGSPDKEYFRNNLVTARNILEFATRSGIKDIIFTSTMAVYPTGGNPKTESFMVQPESAYGLSKLQAENLHIEWSNNSTGTRVAICRPAVIFGLYDNGNFTKLSKTIKNKAFFYAGRSDTLKSSGYVKDLVESFFFTLNKLMPDESVIYNFAFPDRITIKKTVSSMSKVMHLSEPKIVLPVVILNFGAIIFEILNVFGVKNSITRGRIKKLHNDTNIVPEWLVKNGFEWKYDLSQSLEEWRSECGGNDFF